jgi:AAA+ superfamily predicted ATPase
MSTDDPLAGLREALQLSPDNVPLRLHLADSLLRLGRAEESEQEFRRALTMAPDDTRVKLGLANVFFQQGKNSQALVIVENLIKAPETPARAYVMHARLLFRAGDVERAVREYRKGVDADPAAGDADFAARLGIRTDEKNPFAADDEVVEGRVRAGHDTRGGSPNTDVERPTISFKDVGGMEAVKEEIRMKIIHPLTHPELYKAYGKAAGGGILMYGPPGCGKTHLARATAGEIKAGFVAVGINDVLDMWIGNSEKNLHELFEQARRNRPCVLFFDEVDALGASRSDMRHSGARHIINQFLSEMDGMAGTNDGVLLLAATNAPWHLDSAFRRPGRFDRILFVPPPDEPARAEILRILCRGKPVQDVDHEHLAWKLKHFSGADLKAVVDVAIEAKLREAMKAGAPKPLTTKDLQTAAGNVKPSTREWFATARNYALYSNQGGVYDDILKYLDLQ